MKYRNVIYILFTLFLSSCATHAPMQTSGMQATAFAVTDANSLASRFAPIIISDNPQALYNRVGAPMATYDEDGQEHIYVSPEHPVFYFQQRTFSTAKATYTNLIYRVHFEGVPFSMIPFYLTTGKNVGIFIIVTLDEQQRPIMTTTVHTCGCYLAFTPTQHMPESALPEDWDKKEQHIYGQTLPGLVQWKDQNTRPVITLEDGTHRIRDVQSMSAQQLQGRFKFIPTEIEAVEALKKLPLGDGTTSFFESEGDRKGYVKGASKPWEYLLMSWWALDKNIGVDKDYGDASVTGSLFYTDLNPSDREGSDMWPFGKFLHYWGWRL